MAKPLLADITRHLHARHLHPTPAWLQTFALTIRPNTPLPALKQTAVFRLLATDISTTLAQPAACIFPSNVLDARIKPRQLPGPIVCQIIDIDDMGRSKWSQVEAIEARERGEMTKGREIVRVVDGDQENSGNPATVGPNMTSKGPFKLLLQDGAGSKVYAIDVRGIEGLNVSMAIGTKIVLKNVELRRGVLMLEPGGTQVLGGKLDALDKAWKDGRKQRLIDAAKATAEGRGQAA